MIGHHKFAIGVATTSDPAVGNPPKENFGNKLMFWYAFFMAFPTILIFQNISIFLFPLLLISLYNLTGKFLRIRYAVQVVAVTFGIGAIASSWNIPFNMPSDSFSRSLEVLPNYLYWVLLILLMTSYKQWIRLDVIYRGVFWGTIFSIIYFFLFQDYLTTTPVFKFLTQNTFAFLLICYSPMVVWYTWHRYGFLLAGIVLLVLVLSGFLSGSRSGSLLTLSGGLLTFLLNRKSIGKISLIAIIGLISIVSIANTEIVKGLIFGLNERTYDLVYNQKKTLEEDRSYLVRLAQIEKANIIFNKYPLSGIGLNNFTNYRVSLPGNFEGSKYVVDKKQIDRESAHNSYFGFLAEGGLLLLVPFVALILYCIVWFLLNLNKLKPVYRPIFIGIIHMSIHLYFIYAILNVFAWFLLGLGCMIIVKHKK